MQVYYNLLNPSAARAMPKGWTGQDFARLIDGAKAHDTGIDRDPHPGRRHPRLRYPHRARIHHDRETDVAREEGRTRAVFAALATRTAARAQTAMRFVLANPDIAGVNVGFADSAQLEEALAAFEAGPLPPRRSRG